MFTDERNWYGQEAESGFNEAFYGSECGLDGAFADDQVFAYLNELISDVAQKARDSFFQGFNELKDNPLYAEIAFYCGVFALKLCLFLLLRQGLQKGYSDI
jgi:hypothetical protein